MMIIKNSIIDKCNLDESMHPFSMEKQESDVVDDLFLAVQNIVAGTATMSKTVLSETCFQCTIHLSEEFPLITLKYETKLDKKESVHLIPVVEYKEIDDNSGMHERPSSHHNIIEDTSKEESSFPLNSVLQGIPEFLSVLSNIDQKKNDEFVSFDSSQDDEPSVAQYEMNNCNKLNSDSRNKCDVSEFVVVSLETPHVRTSVKNEQNENWDFSTKNEISDRIVKNVINDEDEDLIDLNEKKNCCGYCGKLFKKKTTVQLHERIHTGEIPFKCEDCGRYFNNLSAVRKHARIHTREKPYTCEECGKSFSYLSLLITHKRVHTGEKPYSCKECGKSFSQANHLNRHKRTHTGEKPFKCDECGNCFAHSWDLINHIRIHTGEKPFKCEKCGKCFLYSSHLSRHKRSHMGVKRFK